MPKLTRIEALKVLDFIRTVCSKPEGEEFAVYQKGWDDKRIARKFNCDKATVERMRAELIGILRPARPKGSGQRALPLGVTLIEFEALKRRVERLERDLGVAERAEQPTVNGPA